MYKICVALIAVLAVAAAKPSLGYSYAAPYSVHDVAPLAASYSAYSAPAVYSAAPSLYPAAHSVYAPSVYSAQSYPVVAKTYAAAPVAAPVATYAAAPYTTYAAAPVASYAAAPLASYAAAPVATYAAAPVARAYSAYSAYPAVGYSGYSAPLSYGSTYGELPLWKKK